jgi:hypothetical protein
VPERYSTWQSVYGLFHAWQLTGTWAAILTGLQALSAEAGLIEWVVSVDSTINRAHQHAAGARRHPEQQKQPPVGEPADHALRFSHQESAPSERARLASLVRASAGRQRLWARALGAGSRQTALDTSLVRVPDLQRWRSQTSAGGQSW